MRVHHQPVVKPQGRVSRSKPEDHASGKKLQPRFGHDPASMMAEGFMMGVGMVAGQMVIQPLVKAVQRLGRSWSGKP